MGDEPVGNDLHTALTREDHSEDNFYRLLHTSNFICHYLNMI